MSLIATHRAADISTYYLHAAIVVITGTRYMRRSRSEAFWTEALPYHHAYHFGAGPNTYAAIAAGVTIMVHKRQIGSRAIMRIWQPTIDDQLCGRFALMRFKHATLDIVVSAVGAMLKIKKRARQIEVEWLEPKLLQIKDRRMSLRHILALYGLGQRILRGFGIGRPHDPKTTCVLMLMICKMHRFFTICSCPQPPPMG